jgi:hypothetical protein
MDRLELFTQLQAKIPGLQFILTKPANANVAIYQYVEGDYKSYWLLEDGTCSPFSRLEDKYLTIKWTTECEGYVPAPISQNLRLRGDGTTTTINGVECTLRVVHADIKNLCIVPRSFDVQVIGFDAGNAVQTEMRRMRPVDFTEAIKNVF